jgi:hypothetical protein
LPLLALCWQPIRSEEKPGVGARNLTEAGQYR